MKARVVVLGAGFGGLELCTILSEAMGDNIDLTLIDKSDSFVFGFSKLDIMFGRTTYEETRLEYRKIVKPGLRFRQETIKTIDPATRFVTTDKGSCTADILVIALGADYDLSATPGLSEGSNEFYTVQGAERLGKLIPSFQKGRIVVGVCSAPFKCPPAPSETALLLHDYLTERRIRDNCEITLVMPFGAPIPPAPEASRVLLAAFAERRINFIPRKSVASLDSNRKIAILDDGKELPYDLFFGVPKHCAPKVVTDAGLTEDGWVPVSPRNLRTRFEGVYAVGDVTNLEVPMAGTFAEGAARVAAKSIISELNNGPQPQAYDGAGSCYVELGSKLVGRIDVNFLSGESATARFNNPSAALATEKYSGASERRARWFGN